jgi:3'-phosphoadenosine 5'-phosphosulfate sulfotransferase
MKDENGELLADSHSILNKWKNYFSQLLNVHNVSNVRQIEVHSIHKLVNSVRNKEELPDQWKESIVPIHKKGDKTDCNSYPGISLLSASFRILSNILLSRLSPYIDEIIGDHQCGF